MSKINEIIVASVLPTIKAVGKIEGKIEMDNVLSGIKANNTIEMYRNTIQGLHSDFSLLKDIAVRTKTKTDDGIIDLILEVVKENAVADGIILS